MCISIVEVSYGCIKGIDEQVKDIIFADVFRFSHDDLIVFGRTCHKNDDYLRSIAEHRKSYIMRRIISPKVIINFLQWHPYGSHAHYKKIMEDDSSSSHITQKKLVLGALELCQQGKINECFGEWSNFISELVNKPVPLYNQFNQLCLYGHGWENVLRGGMSENIIRYTSAHVRHDNVVGLKSSGHTYAKNTLRCSLRFISKDLKFEQPLVAFLHFPYALKAILNSSRIKTRKHKGIVFPDEIWGVYCVYDLKGVMLPDNYKEYVQSNTADIFCSSFDALPNDIPLAFAERYKQQKQNN